MVDGMEFEVAQAVPAVPFPKSYWVSPGRLLAGFYPGAPAPAEASRKLEAIAGAGIRHVVNLMEADERNWDRQPFRPYEPEFEARGITCVRLSVVDVSVPTVDQMAAILDDVDRSLATGRPTYIHCRGGKGRTGTAVGCWLVRHGLATQDDAVARIGELQAASGASLTPSPETPEQRAFVRRWKPGQ